MLEAVIRRRCSKFGPYDSMPQISNCEPSGAIDENTSWGKIARSRKNLSGPMHLSITILEVMFL